MMIKLLNQQFICRNSPDAVCSLPVFKSVIKLRLSASLITICRAAVDHQPVELALRLFGALQVVSLQHLAIIGDHLRHCHGVVAAVLGAIKIDIAGVERCARRFAQPGAKHQLLAGVRVHPDFPVGHVAQDVRALLIPVVYLLWQHAQPTIAVFGAAFSALITCSHVRPLISRRVARKPISFVPVVPVLQGRQALLDIPHRAAGGCVDVARNTYR